MVLKMQVEVLVSAVQQDVTSLAEKMNIETDAFIVNQCERYEYKEYDFRDRLIRCMSMAERGVGLSRNTALMRANKELSLFCDEDIVLYPGYEKQIQKAFEQNPDADIIAFNVKVDDRRKTYYNTSRRRVRWFNYGRYPAYALCGKTQALRKAGVSFSLLFGGGAKYSNGEDSLFLHDCLKKKLHIYTETLEIGQEMYRASTWFHGYTEKFFFDRGVLYHHLYSCMARIWGFRFIFCNRGTMCKDISFHKAYHIFIQGMREAKKRA